MIALTIGTIVMLYMLDRLRLEIHSADKAESRFALFRVRDILRARAQQGDIPYDDWFTYVDTTISRTISEIEQITVWHGLWYIKMYENSERMHRARRNLVAHLQSSPSLAEIDRLYLTCIRDILRQRHRFFWLCLGGSLSTLEFMSDTKKRIVYMFASAPETSTLLEYAN